MRECGRACNIKALPMISNQFTLRGKQFFLTYAQCDLDPEYMLQELVKKFLSRQQKLIQWIIAKEKHADGNDHRHCFLKLEQGWDRLKVPSNFLDIDGHHPNIEHVRSGKAVSKYCTKEGDYITNMKLAEVKTSRNDIAKQILQGRSLKELVQENPSLLFGYARLKQDIKVWKLDIEKPKPLDNTCGVWIAGPSGSGKSTIALTKFGDNYIKDGTKWWDGYDGQATVVCDDVNINWKDIIPYFKWWADKWPFKAEVKNGMLEIRPNRFVVTSNRTLEELLALMGWPKDDYEPYTRRFRVYWITSMEDWEEQL